jgi:hypothetical protein
MSAIGTADSYASDISSYLLANSSSPSDAARGSPAPGPAGASSDSGRGPATRVDLSDRVKDILARANTDRGVADRLEAFVDSLRSNGASSSGRGASSSGKNAAVDVNKAFEQLSGGTPADDGSYAPIQVAKNFATGLKADGYSVSAIGRASDGSFQVQIVGPDGKSFLDRRFGTTGEYSIDGITSGAVQSYQRNKEYVTFSDNEVAATNVTASTDAGTVSAVSVGTHSASVTFVVDFSTGAISMAQTEQTSVSTNVQIARPGSAFSTLA